MARKPRNYKKEYADYQGTEIQKKRRADRNRARREAEKRLGESALRGKEVDHLGSHRTGRLKNVKTKVVSKHANRIRQPDRPGGKRRGR